MEKKGRAIILLTNSKYIFACGTFIMNIIEAIPNFDNIIIYYDDLTSEEKDKLLGLDERIRLELYSLDEFINEFGLDRIKYTKSSFYKRFTHLATSKIRLFSLLNEYKQIIFFDTDMLLRDDLSELLNQTEYDIIWAKYNTVSGILSFCGYDISKLPDNEFYRELSLIPVPNGGFFIANDNFDPKYMIERGRDFLKLCFDNGYPCLFDEVSIGYGVYKENLKVLSVNLSYYNTYSLYATTSSKLIHFFGFNKPWASFAEQAVFNDWLDYFNKFKNIYGESFPIVKEFPNIGWFISRDIAMEMFLSLINQVALGRNIKYFIDLNSKSIYIIYNNFFFFKIYYRDLPGVLVVELYIDKIVSKFYKDADSKWRDFIKSSKNGKELTRDSYYIFNYGQISNHSYSMQFQQIYESTATLRELSILHPNNKYIKRGKLKTYFKYYVGFDGFRLIQTSNLDEALEVLLWDDIIAFKLPGEDRYIQYISELGIPEIGEKREYFKVIYKNDKIAIKICAQHLSARNDAEHSIKTVPQCLDWEYYEFISKKELARL